MKISKIEYIPVPEHIKPLLPKDFINLPLKSILYNDYDSTFVKFEELDRNPYTLNNSDSACFENKKRRRAPELSVVDKIERRRDFC